MRDVTGALVVFCVTYLLIASRQLHFLKLDRPAGAVVGAVAMVVVGLLTWVLLYRGGRLVRVEGGVLILTYAVCLPLLW